MNTDTTPDVELCRSYVQAIADNNCLKRDLESTKAKLNATMALNVKLENVASNYDKDTQILIYNYESTIDALNDIITKLKKVIKDQDKELYRLHKELENNKTEAVEDKIDFDLVIDIHDKPIIINGHKFYTIYIATQSYLVSCDIVDEMIKSSTRHKVNDKWVRSIHVSSYSKYPEYVAPNKDRLGIESYIVFNKDQDNENAFRCINTLALVIQSHMTDENPILNVLIRFLGSEEDI